MKKLLYAIFLFGVLPLASVFGVVFAFYFFIGFMSLIFNDPFHWVQPPPEPNRMENATWELQSKICIEKGGIPIKSAWNGNLKDCKFN